MTDRELTLIIIALEYGTTLEEVKDIYNRWNEKIDDVEQQEHGGDCTNECYGCMRCVVEDAKEMIPIYRYLFGL